MESINRIIFGLLILHLHVNAAPNDVSKIEDIAKVTQGEQLHLEQELDENQGDEKATGSQREKRWYNPYGFGLPPVSPDLYPIFNKRQNPPASGYGYEDPLEQIHRRVQEIAGIVRQPAPPVPNFPFLFPVLIVPSGDCQCNDRTEKPTRPPSRPPPTYNPPEQIPNVTERWPEMEDDRQNWGLLVNDTESEEGDDFSRPISFDPIRPVRPGNRPPPPVEHGSVQSDSQNGSPNSPPTFLPSSPAPPASTTPKTTSSTPPSPCDAALLTCCHQPVVTYECFAVQGCPGFTSLGNPCTPTSILRVIEIYQRFYGQKSR